MLPSPYNKRFHLRILSEAEEMSAVEELQRIVWPGNELDVIPRHLLLTAAHNGGLVIGGYQLDTASSNSEDNEFSFDITQDDTPPLASLAGFVFGFPGLYDTPDGPRLKHCSHMLAVHPIARDLGLGFTLKRAQWQMVRRQGIDRITWTYDPLLSRNAFLNISRLGAVCNTYIPDAYGAMNDGLNAGLPSDRLQVDWWLNTQRVSSRLSKKPRLQLDLAHFLAAGIPILNPTQINRSGSPQPIELDGSIEIGGDAQPLMLIEIPNDFMALKSADMELALAWRQHSRDLFQRLFNSGFIITDFIHLPGTYPRSFYVFSYGEQTL